jgi:spermidine synthase
MALVCLVALLSGAGTMMVEVACPRLFQPYFGGSVFVWTNLIAVFLVALAAGYHAGGVMAGRPRLRPRAAALLLASGAWIALLPLFFRFMAPRVLPAAEALGSTASAAGYLSFGSFAVAVAIVAPPILLLGALSPILVRLLADSGLHAGGAAGRVMTCGTFGSFAGTMLPTYWLVPHVGSTMSFLVAAAFVLASGLLLVPYRRPRAAVAAAGVVAIMGFTYAGLPRRAALDGERLLREVESRYQYLRVTETAAPRGTPERFLRINEGVLEYHSVAIPGKVTTDGRYYDALGVLPGFFAEGRALDALVLGSGAGTTARLLRGLWGERIARVVNVEIDPAVVALAPDLFAGERPDLGAGIVTVVHDGRGFVRGTTETFDLLYVDAYVRQTDIPFHMATREFFELLYRAARPGGILAMNVSALDVEQPLVRRLGATIRAAGWSASIAIPLERYPSLVLCARRDAELDWSQVRAPAELADVLAYGRRFHTKIEHADPRDILTDDFAPVEYLGLLPAKP